MFATPSSLNSASVYLEGGGRYPLIRNHPHVLKTSNRQFAAKQFTNTFNTIENEKKYIMRLSCY